MTDAAHNATDILALALTWYTLRLTSQPAHAGKTFGYHRAGILAALAPDPSRGLANSTTLLLITLWIFYEAYQRLILPAPVDAGILTGPRLGSGAGVAAIAFVINAGTAWLVKRGSARDLNLRSAFVHLAGDAAATFGGVLAGLGIALTGMTFLDPLASVLIGLLILWNAWGIIRETVSILLESTPADVDMSVMMRDLLSVEGVRGVHDLHVWSVTQELRALSAHVLTDDIPISAGAVIQRQVNEVLFHRHGKHMPFCSWSARAVSRTGSIAISR